MKNILITGTRGFIGKHLYNELNNKFNISEINEDIFDVINWTEELDLKLKEYEPEVIFHVGACSNTLETNVNYMMTRNYEFTKILSDYAFINDIKLIYSSSAANYGINGIYPSNLYGWSKYIAEQHVLQNGGIALRYFNVYGPGEEHKDKMASVAYQMYLKHLYGEDVMLFPKQPKRDFIYIKDVISANIFAFENYDELSHTFYDVGTGIARTFEDVLKNIGLDYGYHDASIIPVGYQFHTQSDKNKWLKGWEPKYSLEWGLAEYLVELKKLKK
jgi:ADP-L-glycero-D-manno-heptose 6-epimerase